MVEYRLRRPYRIAAYFPGIAFLAMTTAAVIESFPKVRTGYLEDLGLLALGVVTAIPAFFLQRIAWTGRVPAYVEEYGLDGPGEIEAARDLARKEGRLYE